MFAFPVALDDGLFVRGDSGNSSLDFGKPLTYLKDKQHIKNEKKSALRGPSSGKKNAICSWRQAAEMARSVSVLAVSATEVFPLGLFVAEYCV